MRPGGMPTRPDYRRWAQQTNPLTNRCRSRMKLMTARFLRLPHASVTRGSLWYNGRQCEVKPRVDRGKFDLGAVRPLPFGLCIYGDGDGPAVRPTLAGGV